MSTYRNSSLPGPLPRDPSGRHRHPTRGGRGPASPADLLRRRLLAVLLLGLIVAPVVWALRGDNNAVDVTSTGGASAVVGFDAVGDSIGDTVPSDPATISESDTVEPGEVVALPATEAPVGAAVAPTTPPAPSTTATTVATTSPRRVCATEYVVQSGDSWYGLAAQTGVKASLIAGSNNMTIRSPLVVGQKICLPAGAVAPTTTDGPTNKQAAAITSEAPAKPACASKYTVVTGDSWYGIARKVVAKATDVVRANGMSLKSALHVGDVICLPPGAVAPKATTAPAKSSGHSSNSSKVSVRRYSRDELEQIVRNIWPDNLEADAMYVVNRESNWNNLSENSCCVGLFQLNYNAHNSWMKAFGVTDRSQLFDPELNARLALVAWQRSGSWRPWCTANWCPTS